MLIFILLFLSFFQIGFLGIGGYASTQALIEHEVITLHHWLTPAQMADLMTFCRALPGGTGLNSATLAGALTVSGQYACGVVWQQAAAPLGPSSCHRPFGQPFTAKYRNKTNISRFTNVPWWYCARSCQDL